MAGLVLSLKPNEKFLVNGALLENGPKRSQIRIETDGVNVLRLSDVIHPEEANTPIKRIYYSAQLVLSGDDTPENTEPTLTSGLETLLSVFEGTDYVKNIAKALNAVKNGRYYSVLCALKPLLTIEKDLLARPTLAAGPLTSRNAVSELAATG